MSTALEIDVNSFIQKSTCAEELAKSSANVALRNFEWRFATLILYNTTFLSLINIFTKFYDKNIIISSGLFNSNLSNVTQQYVLFGDTLSDITFILDWMQKNCFDNIGKHIIICLSENDQDCNESEAVKTFWNYKVVNVVFVKMDPANKVHMYTYFHGASCGISGPVRTHNLGVFPEKFSNLHKCPIIVSTFHQPPYMYLKDGIPSGIEGDLLLIIMDALNATLKIHRASGWGLMTATGGWTGTLGDVYDGLANFSMTVSAATYQRTSYFKISVEYSFVSVGWLIHPPKKVPPSLKLLRPFGSKTLLAITIIFLSVILCAMFMKSSLWSKFARKLQIPQSRNVVFASWTICMGLPIKRFPTNQALLSIVFLWIWYCFLIRTFYQAALINSLKTDIYYPNFDTVEELVEANYDFAGPHSIKDYYTELPKLFKKYIGINLSETFAYMDNVSKGAKVAIGVNLEHGTTFVLSHPGGLYFLPQKTLTTPIVLYFKKYSALVEPINNILRYLAQSGLPSKLYKDYRRPVTGPENSVHTNDPITLKHFTGCYAILMCGWILSFLCFLIEVSFRKLKKS